MIEMKSDMINKMTIVQLKAEVERLRGVADQASKAAIGTRGLNRSLIAYIDENEKLKNQIEELEDHRAELQRLREENEQLRARIDQLVNLSDKLRRQIERATGRVSG